MVLSLSTFNVSSLSFGFQDFMIYSAKSIVKILEDQLNMGSHFLLMFPWFTLFVLEPFKNDMPMCGSLSVNSVQSLLGFMIYRLFFTKFWKILLLFIQTFYSFVWPLLCILSFWDSHNMHTCMHCSILWVSLTLFVSLFSFVFVSLSFLSVCQTGYFISYIFKFCCVSLLWIQIWRILQLS